VCPEGWTTCTLDPKSSHPQEEPEESSKSSKPTFWTDDLWPHRRKRLSIVTQAEHDLNMACIQLALRTWKHPAGHWTEGAVCKFLALFIFFFRLLFVGFFFFNKYFLHLLQRWHLAEALKENK
jgi:hypothetical protein